MADYLVATLGDRIQAEAVYVALQKAGLPESNLSIFGTGYKTSEACDRFDPALIAQNQVKRMMFFLLPLGCLGGVIFYQSIRLDVLPGLGRIVNSVMGGLLGATAGALGGFITGGGLKVRLDKTVPYAQQLQSGKYLVVVQDADNLKMRQANRTLMTLNIDKVAFYERPD
ncbi:MAG: hypothetical protein HC851_08890 [Acaryochloris sp. RU_4_1]|nr:hypothetical protein [Acaryochloris sp. RU_4_1]NJR53673.1 hypothetical protein [Acaryochloris sp. CRU_2_0]